MSLQTAKIKKRKVLAILLFGLLFATSTAIPIKAESTSQDPVVTQSVAHSANKTEQNTLANQHDHKDLILIACSGGWLFIVVLLGTLYSKVKLIQPVHYKQKSSIITERGELNVLYK